MRSLCVWVQSFSVALLQFHSASLCTGRLGFKNIVFKVTEKKGDGSKPKEQKEGELLDGKNAGSGLSDAEIAVMYGAC